MGGGRWYRGDCHVHSVHSTGADLTPEQLAAEARAAGLDFVATTEHNTDDGHDAWAPHAGDDLLVIMVRRSPPGRGTGSRSASGRGRWSSGGRS
jgi:hypothetical protein